MIPCHTISNFGQLGGKSLKLMPHWEKHFVKVYSSRDLAIKPINNQKINPKNLYTIDNTIVNNRQGENGDFTSDEKNEKDEEKDNNIQWEE